MVTILLVIVVGISLIIVSRAAVNTVSIEPENGTKSGLASIGNDASASGGKYLQFGSSLVAGAFYLAPNGSDGNPGTLSQPWKTFSFSLM